MWRWQENLTGIKKWFVTNVLLVVPNVSDVTSIFGESLVLLSHLQMKQQYDIVCHSCIPT